MSHHYYDIVIIGNSAAGLQAIRTIRRYSDRLTIGLIDREDYPAYSRVLTPYFIGGKTPKSNLHIVDHAFYTDGGVTPLFGRSAVRLDAVRHEVQLDDGMVVGYGKLLLALGSEARPFREGMAQVSTLRHMADAEKLALLLKHARSVAALGAGLVSVPVLSHLPRDVERHLIVGSDRIFSRLLDGESAALLEEHFISAGVFLHKRDDISDVTEGERLGLSLASGSCLTADALLVGKGVVPNTTLAREGGLAVRDGILIDDFCQTDHPDIFAAGDAAEGKDYVTGLKTVQGNWITAVEQGEHAALTMCGLRSAYEGSMKNNITEVFGLDVAVVGYCADDAPHTVTSGNRCGGRFRKLFLDIKQRVIGAVLIGETNDSGIYYRMVRGRTPFPGVKILQGENRYGAFMRQIA